MALLSRPSALAAAALLAACGQTVGPAPRDGGDDLAPRHPLGPSARRRARRRAPTSRSPPDNVDLACANGGTDRCLNFPPGPCPDLAAGARASASRASRATTS